MQKKTADVVGIEGDVNPTTDRPNVGGEAMTEQRILRPAVLVWGAGAVGGTLGAYLVRAGYQVTFVDTHRGHAEAMTHRGISVVGPIDNFDCKAPAFHPDRLKGQWNWIFLCVKGQHTKVASHALLPHLTASGCVISFQNGLCEGIIGDVVGADRVMGALINYGADWLEPGLVNYGSRGLVGLGELDGRVTSRLQFAREIVKSFEPSVVITDRIGDYLWGKLCYGAFLFCQGLGKMGISNCFERAELSPLWRGIGTEIESIARAIGVTPKGFNGYEPEAFSLNAPPEHTEKSMRQMAEFYRGGTKTHSGVCRDLAVHGRQTEADFQLGSVIALGKAHDFKSPILERLVSMIHEIEDGRREQSDDNLVQLIGQRRCTETSP